jgi:hypothetical protein
MWDLHFCVVLASAMGWNWNIFFVKKNDGNVLSKNVSMHMMYYICICNPHFHWFAEGGDLIRGRHHHTMVVVIKT